MFMYSGLYADMCAGIVCRHVYFIISCTDEMLMSMCEIAYVKGI